MIPVNLGKDYQAFFDKHESGQYFITQLTELIESEHAKAESNPELSRDHTQRAKGIREVLNHIQSVGGLKN